MRSTRNVVLSRFPRFVRAIGLAFAAMGGYGAVCMLFGIGNMTVSINDGPSRPATPADVWLPGIFIAVGVGLALIRYTVVVDAARRACIKTAGWGQWVKRTETSLASATAIDIGTAVERGGNGSGRYTAIPVHALGPDGTTELAEPRTHVAARALALRIANALALPVGSGLGGTQRTHGDDKVAALPVAETTILDPADLIPPTDTRVTISERLDGLVIHHSMVAFGGIGMLGIVVPMLMLGGFWWLAWRPALSEPAATSTFVWWFMMAPVVAGLLFSLAGVLAAHRRGLFGGYITVDALGGLRTPWRTIASERIRALEVLPGPRLGRALHVVLDDREFVLVAGRSQADLRWIRALILQRLQAGRPAPRSWRGANT